MRSFQDLVDPRSLARARAPGPVRREPSRRRFRRSPSRRRRGGRERVGAPLPRALGICHGIGGFATCGDSLPGARDPWARSPRSTRLLLDDDEHGRPTKATCLSGAPRPTRRRTRKQLRVAPYVTQLDDRARLPWSTWPCRFFRQLSPRQLTAFRDDVTFLIKADDKVSLFEYAVQRLVFGGFCSGLFLNRAGSGREATTAARSPLGVLQWLLSTLAENARHAVHADEARYAFQLGASSSCAEAGARVKFLPRRPVRVARARCARLDSIGRRLARDQEARHRIVCGIDCRRRSRDRSGRGIAARDRRRARVPDASAARAQEPLKAFARHGAGGRLPS